MRQKVLNPKGGELLWGYVNLIEAVIDDLLDIVDALRVTGCIPHHQVCYKDIIEKFPMLGVLLLVKVVLVQIAGHSRNVDFTL